jgi:PAS domain S-box-containing protein
MQEVDPILYIVSSILQLAAMVFAIRMTREVNDKRPWLVLFTALLFMFVFRLTAFFLPPMLRQHISPIISLPVSLLLFISLFSIRNIAASERMNKAAAAMNATQRDESEHRYRSLVELSPDAIFVHAAGKIEYVNDAALKFFGARSSGDLLGRSPLDFSAPECRASTEASIKKLDEDGGTLAPVSERWLRIDGASVPVEIACAVVPWQGGKAIQVILRDISERERAEREKTQLLASERTARSAAEHASRMKDDFLATLSHELRTPLNAILGWSQLLRLGQRTEVDISQGLETIERNARVQTQLIEDLLDMSRITSGKLRLDIQQLSPITFIEAAIATVRPAANGKEIQLESILDPLAGPIRGDPNRLQQVIWNLLSNAIKFTPKGGKVQVLLQRVNSHLEVIVSDNGSGISPDFLPFVFDRFRQADPSTTRRYGGLGLGLAIVKQLVDLHGGQVLVKSPGEGLGTAFTVVLPLASIRAHPGEAERPDPTMHAAAAKFPRSADLRGVKVLVVDDEPDSRHLIKQVLEERNAEILTSSSAALAIPLLRETKPDVIISDIGMPDLDGYEFLRLLRSQGDKTPAIALTAFARSEDRIRALMVGYQVHLSKPVEPSELIATVASVIGRAGEAVESTKT